MNICKLCGHQWASIKEPIACAKCHSHMWKTGIINYKCKRCNYEWTNRKNSLPRRCPDCQSMFWNIDDYAKSVCRLCGYSWFRKKLNQLILCPKCKSPEWEKPLSGDIDPNHVCADCGHKWINEIFPLLCPNCRSPYWSAKKKDENKNN